MLKRAARVFAGIVDSTQYLRTLQPLLSWRSYHPTLSFWTTQDTSGLRDGVEGVMVFGGQWMAMAGLLAGIMARGNGASDGDGNDCPRPPGRLATRLSMHCLDDGVQAVQGELGAGGWRCAAPAPLQLHETLARAAGFAFQLQQPLTDICHTPRGGRGNFCSPFRSRSDRFPLRSRPGRGRVGAGFADGVISVRFRPCVPVPTPTRRRRLGALGYLSRPEGREGPGPRRWAAPG